MKRLVCLLLGLILLASAPAAERPAPEWLEWSPQVFERAAKEKKFVLLDLGAVWCHWCHVMDEKTYADPAVRALLASRYLSVRVDQDSRPDLANRYEDYGWPATVVFAADGSEIAKRRGYLPPREMSAMLRAIIDDPTPGPSVQPEVAVSPAREALLPAERRAELERSFRVGYDAKLGSWGTTQKFLDWDNTERCLALARTGDGSAANMARQTLDAQRQLIDPVWGGVYQYSTHGDWKHPHFEKIMQMQAENLRVYALAGAQFRRQADFDSARRIERYLRDFLTSPDGAFYTSQDADLVRGEHSGDYFKLGDAARRKRGIPRVDQNRYARENGWAILALADLHAATGDDAPLRAARRAADWVIANRALPGGGFRHGESDQGFLGDTLAMGRAFLRFYAVTADPAWLTRANDACRFIADIFKATAGFTSARSSTGTIAPPRPQFDENVQLVRFANLLARHSGEEAPRLVAEHALKYLIAPEVWRPRRSAVGGLLSAEAEFNSAPLHVVVVGRKNDPVAQALYRAALRYPSSYIQLEWLDRTEATPLKTEIPFPESEAAAAYVCGDGACSPPIDDPAKLATTVEKLARRPASR